jgi:hypothetical protein
MARVISADSHVVEGPGVFAGLAERFGDEAPRIMDTDTETDAIVIPSRGAKGAGVGRMGLAGLRLRKGATLSRQPGRKPDVTDLTAPDVLEIINLGYAGRTIRISMDSLQSFCIPVFSACLAWRTPRSQLLYIETTTTGSGTMPQKLMVGFTASLHCRSRTPRLLRRNWRG